MQPAGDAGCGGRGRERGRGPGTKHRTLEPVSSFHLILTSVDSASHGPQPGSAMKGLERSRNGSGLDF